MPDDVKAYNQKLIEEFRANGGVEPGRPLLLLTTKGARTGAERTTPMMFIPEGDRLLVIASNAGAESHPDWYYNLVANPEVKVEVTGDSYAATATVTSGAERDQLFAGVCEKFPFFTEHQAKVSRAIPVVALVRT